MFYKNNSQLTHGTEGDPASPLLGQIQIHSLFESLDFCDAKVLVSNVDSQVAHNGSIVILVLGEISNKGACSQKFSQVFVLAEQPSGYYVLNDIFRFLKDDLELYGDGFPFFTLETLHEVPIRNDKLPEDLKQAPLSIQQHSIQQNISPPLQNTAQNTAAKAPLPQPVPQQPSQDFKSLDYPNSQEYSKNLPKDFKNFQKAPSNDFKPQEYSKKDTKAPSNDFIKPQTQDVPKPAENTVAQEKTKPPPSAKPTHAIEEKQDAVKEKAPAERKGVQTWAAKVSTGNESSEKSPSPQPPQNQPSSNSQKFTVKKIPNDDREGQQNQRRSYNGNNRGYQGGRGNDAQNGRGHDTQNGRGHDTQNVRGHDAQNSRGHDAQNSRGHDTQNGHVHQGNQNQTQNTGQVANETPASAPTPESACSAVPQNGPAPNSNNMQGNINQNGGGGQFRQSFNQNNHANNKTEEQFARSIYFPLKEGLDEVGIRETFSSVGVISELMIPKGKPHCFIEFEKKESAQNAIGKAFVVNGVTVTPDVRKRNPVNRGYRAGGGSYGRGRFNRGHDGNVVN